MGEKSFWKNLENLAKDPIGEIKRTLKTPEAAPSEEVRREELARLLAEREAADRVNADRRVAELRAEMDALFSGPSTFERGARVVSGPDRSYQPKSVERLRLEQRRQMLLDQVNAAKDKRRKDDATAELIRVEEELKRTA